MSEDLFADVGTSDAGREPETLESICRVAAAEIVRLIQQPSRSHLDRFLKSARNAFHRLSAGVHPDYELGQLGMLVEIARTARLQKVPDEALAAMSDSRIKQSIVRTLLRDGRLRVTDLAMRLGMRTQNLASPTRELAEAGLLDREELGRSVFLSATPMAAEALQHIPAPSIAIAASNAERSVGDAAATAAIEPPPPLVTRAPIDLTAEIRRHISAFSERVQMAPDTVRMADQAAREFEQRFAIELEQHAERTSKSCEAQRVALVKRLAEYETAHVPDADLGFLGDDPAVYFPGVLTLLPEGGAVLRVMRYVEVARELPQAGVKPAQTSARLLYIAAQRRSAQPTPQQIPVAQFGTSPAPWWNPGAPRAPRPPSTASPFGA
jgi:DNA-binding MarR family transcriptional regulator